MTRDELLKYLSGKTRADLSQISDTAELFSTGMIDSFAMVDLLFWLEKKTGGKMGPDDVSMENLDTVERILAFCASRAS